MERVRYEQQYRLVDGALQYAVEYVCTESERLKNHKEIQIDLKEYAQLLHERYSMDVLIVVQKKIFFIKTILSEYVVPVLCGRCRVKQSDGKKQWIIDDWRIGE